MNTYLKNFIDKKFKKPGSALDLGAGDFFDVASLRQLGWECEGVDINNGVDLENKYLSKSKPFDLVYSNYLIHKIKNKNIFAETIYNNLANNGWFFVQTFDHTDNKSSSNLSQSDLRELFIKNGFKNIEVKIFSHYDNDIDHKHWHKILEVSGQKNK